MSIWDNPKADELLRQHYITEGKSCAQTAAILNQAFGGSISRNAVIGRAYRKGWTTGGPAEHVRRTRVATRRINGPPKFKKPPAEKRLKPPPPAALQPTPSRPASLLMVVTGTPVVLADLEPGQCKFALNDPPPGEMDRTLFCAAPQEGEGPYCKDHHHFVVDHVGMARAAKRDRKSPRALASTVRDRGHFGGALR